MSDAQSHISIIGRANHRELQAEGLLNHLSAEDKAAALDFIWGAMAHLEKDGKATTPGAVLDWIVFKIRSDKRKRSEDVRQLTLIR